jgi:hypothetical protein
VRCVEDERCSASFPHAFPAVLRVYRRLDARRRPAGRAMGERIGMSRDLLITTL